MGVDAEILVKMTQRPTDEELVALAEALHDQVDGIIEFSDAPPAKLLSRVGGEDRPEGERMDYETGAHFRVQCLNRYYGPGYERGYWPTIGAVLEFFMRRLPGAVVFYGGDSCDTLPPLTREGLDALWDYWACHGNAPYHGRRKS